MMILLSLIAGLAVSSEVNGAMGTVAAPVFHDGDTWTETQTIERGTQGFTERRLSQRIERGDGETMVVGIKLDGAPTAYQDHVLGTDWSLRRIIDGKDVVTARPLIFPLTVGRSWTIDFTDSTPRGTRLTSHVRRTYTVAGWESVTVPAGTFMAVKILVSGLDQGTEAVPAVASSGAAALPGGGITVAQTQRGGTRPFAVHYQAIIRYAPALRHFADIVEEWYNSDNVLMTRQKEAVTAFIPGS